MPAASLTRTTDGLLVRETFTSLSGWTNVGTGWTAVSDPGYVAHPTPRVFLAPGTAGVDADGGGIREPHLVQVSDSEWHLFADAGNGSDPADADGPWQIQRYSSTDRGLTWTRHGTITLNKTGSAYAAHASFDLSGWINKVGSTYYLQVLSSNTMLGGGRVPGPPYYNSVYTATSLAGPWTWSHDSPLLGASGAFDDDTVNVAHAYWDGTQWVGHYSAYDGGSVWSIGRCTTADLGTAWTKDSVGPILQSAVLKNNGLENPKVWNSSVLSRWFMVGNGNVTDSEELFSAPTGDFSTSSVIRYGLMQKQSPMYTANTLSIISPFSDDDGLIQQDSDGRVPVVWAGDYQGSPPSNYEWHRLRVGYLEPTANAVQFSGGSAVYLTKTQPAQDGVFDFQFESRSAAGSPHMSFMYRLSGSGTADSGSTGYYLDINVQFYTWGLYRLDSSGSFTQIGSSYAQPYDLNGDSRNAQTSRVQVILNGSSHTVLINGVTAITATDGTYSGSLYGFRGELGPIYVRDFFVRSSKTVTVNNVPNGVDVTVRGPGGYPIVTATSSGSAVTVDVPYGRGAIVQVGSDDFTPSGGVWGGDVYDYSAAVFSPTELPTVVCPQPDRTVPVGIPY